MPSTYFNAARSEFTLLKYNVGPKDNVGSQIQIERSGDTLITVDFKLGFMFKQMYLGSHLIDLGGVDDDHQIHFQVAASLLFPDPKGKASSYARSLISINEFTSPENAPLGLGTTVSGKVDLNLTPATPDIRPLITDYSYFIVGFSMYTKANLDVLRSDGGGIDDNLLRMIQTFQEVQLPINKIPRDPDSPKSI